MNLIRVYLRLFAALFFAGSAFAGILPQRLGDFALVKVENYTPADQALYKEYGFDAGEQGQYVAGDRKLDITVIRASDATGAFGIYEWMRPAEGKQIAMGDRAVETGDVTCFQFGNYVIVLKGSKPEEDPLAAMLSILPRFEQTAAPPLLRYMPADGRIANSERYILGPVGLAKLLPGVPPSAVGFHAGAEGQQAEYQAAGGRLTMTLFSYPTPHLARAQMEEIQKLPNVMAKRSVSLIGIVVNPFSRDEAEKLLAKVHYQATLTMSEKTTNSRKENVADLILNIIFLCGIIAGLALMGGIAFGGSRVLLAKLFPGKGYDALTEREFIRLHLEDEAAGATQSAPQRLK